VVADVAVEPSKDPHALYISGARAGARSDPAAPVEFREIILLGEYEELSYQEIAVVLGCAAGTVMSRLGRARSKFGVLLSDTSQTRDRRKASHLEFFGPMRTPRWRDCCPAISWKKVTGTWKAAADIFNTDSENKAIGGESTRFGGRDKDEYLHKTASVPWVRTPLQT
jgi:sigma-70-like protein